MSSQMRMAWVTAPEGERTGEAWRAAQGPWSAPATDRSLAGLREPTSTLASKPSRTRERISSALPARELEEGEELGADHVLGARARDLEEAGVHVLDEEGPVGDEDARGELVDRLIELAEHLLGLAPERDVPDHADRAHEVLAGGAQVVLARGGHLAVRDDGDDHVVPRRGGRPACACSRTSRFSVLRSMLRLSLKSLGLRAGPVIDAAEGLEHRVPVHRLGVLLVEEYGEMLADEVGGIVAEEADGIVDEGEASLGIQLVDDVGQGVDEVLVAPLEGGDAAGEALAQGDEGPK